MPIIHTDGDATEPIYNYSNQNNVRIIAHICNNTDKWGAGFALQLGRKYPQAKKAFHKYYKEIEGGMIQLVGINSTLSICNMFAQNGIRYLMNPNPLRYDWLETCLSKLYSEAQQVNATVQIPYKMGCGLAGGNWNKVESLIKKIFKKEVSIYICEFKIHSKLL